MNREQSEKLGRLTVLANEAHDKYVERAVSFLWAVNPDMLTEYARSAYYEAMNARSEWFARADALTNTFKEIQSESEQLQS